jgi:hypothetical protein
MTCAVGPIKKCRFEIDSLHATKVVATWLCFRFEGMARKKVCACEAPMSPRKGRDDMKRDIHRSTLQKDKKRLLPLPLEARPSRAVASAAHAPTHLAHTLHRRRGDGTDWQMSAHGRYRAGLTGSSTSRRSAARACRGKHKHKKSDGPLAAGCAGCCDACSRWRCGCWERGGVQIWQAEMKGAVCERERDRRKGENKTNQRMESCGCREHAACRATGLAMTPTIDCKEIGSCT